MNRPTCETCPFWKGPPNINYDSIGTCRRYPPKPSGRMPSTDKSDWCGEHPDFSLWKHAQRVARFEAAGDAHCDFFTPPSSPCTLPKGHAGVHVTVRP